MKSYKITLIASLFLLPVLINAQENKNTTQPQQMQIIINGSEVIINGDTLSNASASKISEAIVKALSEEKRNQETEQKSKEATKVLAKEILRICPDITQEQLDRLLNNFPKNVLAYEGLPKDIRYYKEASLTKKGVFRDPYHDYYTPQTINKDYKDKFFIFYTENMYDEGESWCHWILFVADINTGKVERLDKEQTYLEYTLTNQEETIVFNPDECTFNVIKNK